VNLLDIREQLSRMLKVAREGMKEPTARAFASGHAAGLEDAIKVVDRSSQAEQAARLNAAAEGREHNRSYDPDTFTGVYRSIQSVIARLPNEQEDLRETLRCALDSLDGKTRIGRYTDFLGKVKRRRDDKAVG